MIIRTEQGVQLDKAKTKRKLAPLFNACETEEEVINMAWDMLIFARELSEDRKTQIKRERL